VLVATHSNIAKIVRIVGTAITALIVLDVLTVLVVQDSKINHIMFLIKK